MRPTGRFVLDLLRAYGASFVLFTVFLYIIHHTGNEVGRPGQLLGMAMMLALLGVVTSLLLRLFPLGPIGVMFYGVLLGAFTLAVGFGSRAQPAKDVAAMILIGGALMGLTLGFLEVARRRRHHTLVESHLIVRHESESEEVAEPDDLEEWAEP